MPWSDARALRRHHLRPAVSLVTGGACGIGLALARALHARGGHVVVADIAAEAASGAAAALGERASALVVDVTDRPAVAAAFERTAAELGSLDLVANNAGVGIGGQVEELTDAHWRKAVELNLGGVVNGVHAAYPIMREQGRGVILNTASLAGLMPVPGMLPYTTTKWAVVGLSLGLRAEARPFGIQVNVLCPSFVDTPLLDHLYEPPASIGEDFRGRIAQVQPRLLTAEQTARAAMRGLDADDAVIAVGAVARAGWWGTRLAPGAMTRLGSLRRPTDG